VKRIILNCILDVRSIKTKLRLTYYAYWKANDILVNLLIYTYSLYGKDAYIKNMCHSSSVGYIKVCNKEHLVICSQSIDSLSHIPLHTIYECAKCGIEKLKIMWAT
jgi:hypothetical protein